MSLHALTWALYADHKDLDPTARLILIVRADHAGPEGISWPARSTIAGAAGCSTDTVDRRTADLVERGLIRPATPDEVPASWAKLRPDRRPRPYALLMPTGPQVAAPAEPRGRNTPGTGPQHAGHGAAAVRHEPKEPKKKDARASAHAPAGPDVTRTAVPTATETDALIQDTNRRRGLRTDHAAGAARARAALAEAQQR